MDYNRLYWADNSKYEGSFYEGKVWKVHWVDGKKYEGEYKDDKQEGGRCSNCKVSIYSYNLIYSYLEYISISILKIWILLRKVILFVIFSWLINLIGIGSVEELDIR